MLVVNYDGGRYYDVRSGGFQRIAGMLAAVGPTRWLIVDCHAGHRCSNIIVDTATGARHTLPGPSAEPPPAAATGVVAPDGSAAAIYRANGDRLTLHLINLASGSDQQVSVPLVGESADAQMPAWSPDSRWLFVVTSQGNGQGKLAVVDARAGHVESLGVSLPSLSQIAIRN